MTIPVLLIEDTSNPAESLASRELLEALASECNAELTVALDPAQAKQAMERYQVTRAPATVIFEADSEQVAYKISGHQPQAIADALVRVQVPLKEHLEKLIQSQDLMLFIKGTPEQPKCGFTIQLLTALASHGISKFGYFDILRDERVRQGLKAYSQWPTYPQVYWKRELLGGVDIVKEQLLQDPSFVQALCQ
jgi:Grx4 family monothiol glutaredoxin